MWPAPQRDQLGTEVFRDGPMAACGWALLGNRVMGRQQRQGASRGPAQARSLTLAEGASGGVTTGHRGPAFSDSHPLCGLLGDQGAGRDGSSGQDRERWNACGRLGVRAVSWRGHLAIGIPPLPRIVGTKELLRASRDTSFRDSLPPSL